MSKRTLRQILQRLYEPRSNGKGAASAHLEAQVMAAYQARFGRQQWSLWKPHSLVARTAIASVLVIALLGVACELPTSAKVDLGQRIVVQVQPNESNADRLAFQSRLQQALADAGAEQVRILVGDSDAQHLMMDIVAWDEDLSPVDVENILHREIGPDNLLTVNITALSGTVSETLGRRVMRTFFHLDVRGDTAEKLRASILEGLAEQGFDGNAHVEVLDDGSTRKITVEAGTADGSREISNEIILELKEN